jgi:hypothetical protein
LQNSPVQLGSINLQDFEVPQSVQFGGRHRLAVHTLAGGRRIVERLGPDDGDIQFRGIFSGPAAESRARAFDNLRVSGEIVWLTWESFRRRVIVESFTADYQSPWWIAYQIRCVVVHQTRITAFQQTGLAVILAADLGSAISAAAGTTISLAAVQAALSGANVSTTGTSEQLRAIGAVGYTTGLINQQIEDQSATLTTPIPANVSVANLGSMFASKVSCAASLAAGVNVGSYIGRIGANIGGWGT